MKEDSHNKRVFRWRWYNTLALAPLLLWLLVSAWQAVMRVEAEGRAAARAALGTQVAIDKNCLLENGITGRYSGRLAFANDGEMTIFDLDTLDYVTRSPINVMTDADWSPLSGSQLVFGQFGVHLLDTTSWEVTQIADGRFPSWSPDGRQIAYQYRGQPSGIYILTLSSGARRLLPIERLNEVSVPSQPAWSPDGVTLAFVMSDGNGLEVFRVPVTCDETNCPITQLTNAPEQSYDPAWSPDGERIAFTSNRNGSWAIYTMNADGSDVEQLTTSTTHSDFSPTYSPDGQHIAFDRGDQRITGPRARNIHIMRTDGSEITCISSQAGSDPDWTDLPALGAIAFDQPLGSVGMDGVDGRDDGMINR
ncbi:MAG: hypothetical protein SF123_06410 [Chloroflexota bacterium]|nr:hypothetical protein [Chloroflexota bacterium]